MIKVSRHNPGLRGITLQRDMTKINVSWHVTA